MKHTFNTVLVIVSICVLLAGCSPAEPQATPTPEGGAAEGSEAIISATGVVIPAQWAALSARSQDVVSEVLVKEGERVTKGQALVRLGEAEAARAEVARARESLITAERLFEAAQANALRDLTDAYEAVRKAQYELDNFDIPSDIAQGTPAEGVATMYARLEEARKLFEPYRDLEERLEWEMQRDDPEHPKVYRDTAKIYKKRLDDAWADFNKAIRWADLEAELQQAKSELRNAQKEFESVSGGAQQPSLRGAQYEAAQANLSAAEAALANAEMTAPFDGVVAAVDTRLGEWVAPGMPILQLGDLGNLRVETTDLSEIDAARVHAQDTALVTFDALPEVVVNGTVLRVGSKSAEGSGVNYTAVIVLDSVPAGLRWGMTAFVDIKVSP